MLTDDPVREAEFRYMAMDALHEQQANDYAERVTASLSSLETFKEFLNDLDPDSPEVQVFHGCMDEDRESKIFAYDIMMSLFEEYVNNTTEF